MAIGTAAHRHPGSAKKSMDRPHWAHIQNPRILRSGGSLLHGETGRLLAQPPPFSPHLPTMLLTLVGLNLLAVTLLSRTHRTQLLDYCRKGPGGSPQSLTFEKL